MTDFTHAAVADVFAELTAEAFDLPRDAVPAPDGERLVALMNDWLATKNWRFAYVRDPQTFAWPGSWIALATDERFPTGWRPVLMFGDPSGPLHDPLGDSRELRILHGLLPVPMDRRGWRTDFAGARPTQTRPGQVIALMTAPRGSEEAISHNSITARPGGIDGDRYQAGIGTFSTDPRRVGQDLTLIEAEALDELAARGVSIAPEQARRNIVTRGIDLDALIGKSFRIGEVECFGQRRAEPCAHLERLEPGTLRGLVHRGGIRADILSSGEISIGDPLTPDTT
jgi:hypothetical protein